MRLALYQPDIPPNLGTMLRLAACLGVAVDIVEPCGFPLGDRTLRRAALDYAPHAEVARHDSWEAFLASEPDRLVLLSTRAPLVYTEFAFRPGDVLLLGRESSGAPETVHARADARVRIPLAGGLRSLNVAVAAAMVLGEALRQTNLFPHSRERP
jgi:tRNA (cytidine/uridine-2'-O-)-methyltransferase